VHKYIRSKFNFGTSIAREETVYVCGYKVNGHTHYNYILPDDRIVQSCEDILLSDYGIKP